MGRRSFTWCCWTTAAPTCWPTRSAGRRSTASAASACLNICPVYERTGGHAYNSVYPGPIGAILTPQLVGVEHAASLPYASSLCGACYEVCPVKINIPEVLVHLRTRAVAQSGFNMEKLAMGAAIRMFDDPGLLETAQKIARVAQRRS